MARKLDKAMWSGAATQLSPPLQYCVEYGSKKVGSLLDFELWKGKGMAPVTEDGCRHVDGAVGYVSFTR